MYLLDNFIREKFLRDISALFDKYDIKINRAPINTLLTRLLYNKEFDRDIYNLYTEHYKRNLAVIEALATNQNLEIERQVSNLVRNHITISNIKLTLTHLENLYYSYINQEVVNPPKVAFKGIYIVSPETFPNLNPCYLCI